MSEEREDVEALVDEVIKAARTLNRMQLMRYSGDPTDEDRSERLLAARARLLSAVRGPEVVGYVVQHDDGRIAHTGIIFDEQKRDSLIAYLDKIAADYSVFAVIPLTRLPDSERDEDDE